MVKSLKIDFWLFSAILVLCAIGLMVIYSSSGPYAVQKKLPESYFMSQHLSKLILGFGLMFGTMLTPVHYWRRLAKPLWLLSIFFLILVLIPGVGKNLNGAQRWLNLGFVTFQPSEFAKFATIMFLALKFEQSTLLRQEFYRGFIKPLLISLGAVCGLIIIQPNFSMVMSIVLICLTLSFVAEVKFKHLLYTMIPVLPALVIVAIAAPYRLKRLVSFWDADKNVDGAYQQVQALVSLGHGGFWGTGFGEGTQKLGYLPMPFTDTIYAVLGEELGLIRGTLVVLICFGIIIWRGVEISKGRLKMFESLLAVGIVISLALNVMIHVGVCTGLIPTTGQTLPLISFGGSSLLINLAALGILLGLSRPQEHEIKTVKSIHQRNVL